MPCSEWHHGVLQDFTWPFAVFSGLFFAFLLVKGSALRVSCRRPHTSATSSLPGAHRFSFSTASLPIASILHTSGTHSFSDPVPSHLAYSELVVWGHGENGAEAPCEDQLMNARHQMMSSLSGPLSSLPPLAAQSPNQQ